MYYDVLVNYCKPDSKVNTWCRLSGVRNYNRVLYLFKKEINSVFNFVYVRKISIDRLSTPHVTNFKLIHSFSYTFAHFPEVDIYVNDTLDSIFNKLKDNESMEF